MQQTTRPPAKAENRFKLYSQQEIIDAIDKLAATNKANGKRLNSRSKIFNHAAMLLVRRPENIALLRKAGFPVADLVAK